MQPEKDVEALEVDDWIARIIWKDLARREYVQRRINLILKI